jgi:hypothetical protein
MKKILVSTILALVILLGITTPLMAATTAVVTVTYTPLYIAISISPDTWTINGLTGNSKILVNTTYYSNPLGDTTAPSSTVDVGETEFLITNTSNVAIDLTATAADASGGGNVMTNANSATPGASSYSMYCYYTGETFASKVLAKSSGSTTGNAKSNLAATTNLSEGLMISTQTGAWSGTNGSSFTVTYVATAH